SIAELVLSGDDPNIEFLDVPGSRIRVTYRGEHLFSGPVTQISGWRKGQPRTYSFVDDWFLLQNLGWVMPVAGAYSSGQLAPTSDTDDAQSYNTTAGSAGIADGSGYYNVVASVAETVVKEIVTANL